MNLKHHQFYLTYIDNKLRILRFITIVGGAFNDGNYRWQLTQLSHFYPKGALLLCDCVTKKGNILKKGIV